MTSILTIEELIEKTQDLPSMPAAALAVMRETESSTSTAQSVADALSQDQALTARVLRLSNSAYYGLQRQVMDAQDSVIVLGMRCVRNLALVASTYPWMMRELRGYMLGPKEMWAHSFGVAIGAKLVADRTGKASEDQAFTAGLLHNIGKLVLSMWLETRINSMIKMAQQDRLTFDEVERRVIGFDHMEVGGYLADGWNLPVPLMEAMRYHHTPDSCPHINPLVDCVHIGDYLTMSMGIGLGGDGLRYNFCDTTLERLNLTPEKLEELASDFVVSYTEHERMFEDMHRK